MSDQPPLVIMVPLLRLPRTRAIASGDISTCPFGHDSDTEAAEREREHGSMDGCLPDRGGRTRSEPGATVSGSFDETGIIVR